MEPSRFLLRGDTLKELQDQVRREHGPNARIIQAERVTVGGIRGFFAREHYEATVEVLPPRQRSAHGFLDTPARLGIAALLDDADKAELFGNGILGEPAVSTESVDFAALMDDLTFATAKAPIPMPGQDHSPAQVRARPRTQPGEAPAYLTGSGDLVIVIGLTDEAVAVARSLARRTPGGEFRVGGALAEAGVQRVDDRRDALGARARGVELDQAVFVAFGLSKPGLPVAVDLAMRAASLASVAAEQVWVVVDAGRKPEDTALWVNAVAESVPIDGILATGRFSTATPESVTELQLPVRWLDPATSASPSGRRAATPERGLADRSR
ncbi:hypothetical protein [Cryobacterium sp. CG_9.6]|uniref:hypothetical protein n=1 Tax=Cryobacterium sp. CG_9.6 TaxID=2760710 RepID=UPI002473D29E|nr:hypothetical protein [Cryobacterium sp. CG_9.6]MDH6237253.1 hypothetical protein [Cryobacterium sp. CG_9.6]